MRRRRRWRLGVWLALAACTLFVAAYAWLTDPGRLRRQALAAIRGLGIEQSDIGEVTFSPWDGIRLTEVVVQPAGSPLYEARRSDELPPFLRVGGISIRGSLIDVLLGRFASGVIELEDVRLTCVCGPGDAPAHVADEGETAGERLVAALLESNVRDLPSVRIEQLDFQLYTLAGSGPQLLQRLLLSGSGERTPDGYRLRIVRRGPRAETFIAAAWDAVQGVLGVQFEPTELHTLLLVLPRPLTDAVASWRLAGTAALKQLTFLRGSRRGAGSAELRVAGAEINLALRSATVPLESAEALAAAPGERFLELTDSQVDLQYSRPSAGEPGRLEVRARGRLRGAELELGCELAAGALESRIWGPPGRGLTADDVLAGTLQVTGLEVPTEHTHPAFVHAPALRGPIAAVFRDYEPSGRVDLQLTLSPAAPGTDPATRINGALVPRGARCRYRHFPYPVGDVRGQVRFADGRVLFDELSGRHAGGQISVTGHLNNTRSWTGFDLVFRGANVPLDAALFSALPREYRELWHQAQPLGVCDLQAHVRRAEGDAERGTLPPTVTVDAHLLGGALSMGDGRRLDHSDGWIRVRDGAVELQNVHGFAETAALAVDAHVEPADAASSVTFALYDLPVQQSLAPQAAGRGPALHYSGQADVWGRIQNGPGEERRQLAVAQLKTGSLRGRDPTRTWVLGTGLVRACDDVWEVLRLTAHQETARLELAGLLPSAGAAGAPLELELVAAAPALERLYPQFLPVEWTRIVDELGLHGAGQAQVSLFSAPDETGQAADIEVTAAGLKPRRLPLELRDFSGTGRLAPGRFQVLLARAAWGDAGLLEVSQAEPGHWDAEGLRGTLSVSATEFALTPALVAALPAQLGELCTRLAARGTFDLDLPDVQLRGSPGEAWRVAGRVHLRDAALRVGLDLVIERGVLQGTVTANAAGATELDTEFTIEHGTLDDRPIDGWEGRLLRVAGDRWVRLQELSGRICDGFAQGSCHLDPQSGEYELSLTLHDVAANKLFPPRDASTARPGRVDGELWLRGRGTDLGMRMGGGKLRIRGSSFVQLPVVDSIIRLRPETPDEIEWADVRFLLTGRQVRLERIDIHGRELRLVGEGTWNTIDQRIALTFVAAPPRDWPRVGMLSDLVESAGQELVQYRVEGTLDAPRVRAAPLHRVSDPVLRLLRGDE